MRPGEEQETHRLLLAGRPEYDRCDNKISTSKYTILTFLPVSILEQFRRVANLYFLCIGCIMAVGYYTELFESAISPWTTLGPLSLVMAVSLLQEGSADAARHRSDSCTNNHGCVILRRADDLEESNGVRDESILGGKSIKVSLDNLYPKLGSSKTKLSSESNAKPTSTKVAYESVKRMNIRQGHVVLIRNRDMVPADLVLLASSGDGGNAYIETSSIDGETNLKLRTIPHLPKEVLEANKRLLAAVEEEDEEVEEEPEEEKKVLRETLEQATRRMARLSILGFPNGTSALHNPANPQHSNDQDMIDNSSSPPTSGLRMLEKGRSVAKFAKDGVKGAAGAVKELVKQKSASEQEALRLSLIANGVNYVSALKTEPPNASVNTFSGVMVLPPTQLAGPSIEVPLNADNVLLRGAVLRNTEWAIGVAVFTGTDTKLVKNSFDTPSKFSQLDRLMNRTVLYIVIIMVFCISYLASLSVITNNAEFDKLWYVGYSPDGTVAWPYLPDLDPPEWRTSPDSWLQVFFLFVTLLNNFVPLSLYVTVEMITLVMRILINYDINMYDSFTDTRTVARSTTVTDLGQVEYIFSDKTGTLTQNVMRFKRCSVDGLVFGAPVMKTSPDADNNLTGFHPLNKLLIGKLPKTTTSRQASMGLEELGGEGTFGDANNNNNKEESPKPLTFNGEMFMRVMSLCHTVVVEQDYDANTENVIKSQPTLSNRSSGSFGASLHKAAKKMFGLNKKGRSPGIVQAASSVDDVSVPPGDVEPKEEAEPVKPGEKGRGGAPPGFAYQAESPDEGALVEASSQRFDFQVFGRDSTGIHLAVRSPSLLSDEKVRKAIKSRSISEADLATDTASPDGKMGSETEESESEFRQETWEILAVNKFDSTRKRMSVLVRSPPEFGSIPMLLIKGADSAMLDPNVVADASHIFNGDEDAAEITRRGKDGEDGAAIINMQSHLGEFAREGLRTLVLGVRVLTEDQCNDWLAVYTAAATSIKNRDENLTAAAAEIETQVHIVGATAIEDKLQVGVPETIKMMGLAGIKLWVLTGDKRETAKEIGYATQVLNEKMRPGMIEVAKAPAAEVRTKMAMAFLKLVKYAKLPDYQIAQVGEGARSKRLESFLFHFGKKKRRFTRMVRRFFHRYIKVIYLYCFSQVLAEDPALVEIDIEEKKESETLQITERRRNVRNRAEKIVRDYLETPAGKATRKVRVKIDQNAEIPDEDLNMAANDGPNVFSRADSANALLQERRSIGQISETEVRDLTMVNLTAHEVTSGDHEGPLVDEDVLSMRSFLPTAGEETRKNFDGMKRTLLEKLFAVDKSVRHGRLVKHLNDEKLATIREDSAPRAPVVDTSGESGLEGPRALVIEGAALEKLLGDSELEELLFAVANTCDSVIACRVSPAQKAQLVQLVRRYVVPEPVTLAIGDGANDVGMIQEAHVGVGISGKEGQQAVNASDFAIAQFRFLEDLVLVHGRWNFMRQCTVVLFSFYKNAVMAGVLITFTDRTMYSGTPLFDEWVIAMLNFVAGMPIAALGFFDRCLDKEYIKKHPEVYTPTRRNELITKRTLIRWILLVFVHVFTLYYLTVPSMTSGGGVTAAFFGLMGNENRDRPGDGEGGDLKSCGLVTYTCMLLLLAYKVVYESKSIIVGRWPPFTCSKNKGEGFINRLAYTWIANAYFSFLFYLFAIYIYNSLGRHGPSEFSGFVDTVTHVFNTRSRAWMIILFCPVAGMIFDVTGKLFSNVFYPTQTQIHVERFAKGLDKLPAATTEQVSGSDRV